MVRIFFVILWCCLMTLLELMVQAFGLMIPFLACFLFYLARYFPLKYALTAAVFGTAILDFCIGRAPVSVIAAVLIVLFGKIWTRQMGGQNFFLHILPGALIPLIFYLPWILWHYSFRGFPVFTPHLLLSALFTALTLPLWVSLFHLQAKQAALETDGDTGTGETLS